MSSGAHARKLYYVADHFIWPTTAADDFDLFIVAKIVFDQIFLPKPDSLCKFSWCLQV
jgi:hypothetical protein